MKKICSELDGPCLANNIEAGATPVLNALQLEKIGYALMTHPLAVTYAITHAVTNLMETIKKDGTTDAFINRLTTFDDFNEIIENDLEPNIYSFRILEAFLSKSQIHPFHIKFNTC